MRDYVLTLLVAAAVTYLLTPLVRRGAIRAGIMFEPRARDVHTGPVPRGGGVAMYFGLAAGLLVADQLPQLRSGFAQTGMVPGLLLAGALLVVVGIIDDRWGLSAILQLVAQIGAGAILVATGTQLLWLPWPGGGTLGLTPDESTLLTILVVVATINAVNFIDGLDGLAAGVVAKAAAALFRLVEPGAGPLRDGLEGRQQQVALVGEVVRQDGRARSGGVSDVAEGQRLQAAGSDKLGGGRGDVAATRVVVDVSRHLTASIPIQ